MILKKNYIIYLESPKKETSILIWPECYWYKKTPIISAHIFHFHECIKLSRIWTVCYCNTKTFSLKNNFKISWYWNIRREKNLYTGFILSRTFVSYKKSYSDMWVYRCSKDVLKTHANGKKYARVHLLRL